MADESIDWSQYAEPEDSIDWSQYEEKEPANVTPSHSSFKPFLDTLIGGGEGVVQGLSDIGANVANFIGQGPSKLYTLATGKPGYEFNAPKPSYQEYVPLTEEGQRGSDIGQFAAPFVLPGVGAEALASKIFTKALAGAGLGAAQSEDRLLGAGLGAVGGLVPGAAKLLKSSTSKNIANKLVEDRDAIKKVYQQKYADLFKEAKEKELDRVTKPQINLHAIYGSGMPKYHEALEQFMHSPTLENAHLAQSGLGQLQRKLGEISERQGLTPKQVKAYKETIDAKHKIREAMFADHNFGAQPELAAKYNAITEGYRKDVVPWRNAMGLNDFTRGEIRAKDLVSQLKNNKKFMAQLAQNYPQLKVNQLSKNNWLRGAIASALGLEGLNEIHSLFK